MPVVDLRCTYHTCTHKEGIYRMVGRCGNCGATDLLFLVSEGHTAPTSFAHPADCPHCGCQRAFATRLATDAEIPVAFEQGWEAAMSQANPPEGNGRR